MTHLDETPVLTRNRVWWVTVQRPKLIAAGNLIETPAMKAEAEEIRRQLARDGKGLLPPLPPAQLDYKARASGERPTEPDEVPF